MHTTFRERVSSPIRPGHEHCRDTREEKERTVDRFGGARGCFPVSESAMLCKFQARLKELFRYFGGLETNSHQRLCSGLHSRTSAAQISSPAFLTPRPSSLRYATVTHSDVTNGTWKQSVDSSDTFEECVLQTDAVASAVVSNRSRKHLSVGGSYISDADSAITREICRAGFCWLAGYFWTA